MILSLLDIHRIPPNYDFNKDTGLQSSFPGNCNKGSIADLHRLEHFHSQSFPTKFTNNLVPSTDVPVLILLMVVRVALGSQVDEEATVTTIPVMRINSPIC